MFSMFGVLLRVMAARGSQHGLPSDALPEALDIVQRRAPRAGSLRAAMAALRGDYQQYQQKQDQQEEEEERRSTISWERRCSSAL